MIDPQNYYTLKLYLSFKPTKTTFRKCFLNYCSKEFIRFICECLLNLLHGKVPGIGIKDVKSFEAQLKRLISKRTPLSERRAVLSSKKGLKLMNTVGKHILLKFSNYFDGEERM